MFKKIVVVGMGYVGIPVVVGFANNGLMLLACFKRNVVNH